jgi:hypothetical protein
LRYLQAAPTLESVAIRAKLDGSGTAVKLAFPTANVKDSVAENGVVVVPCVLDADTVNATSKMPGPVKAMFQ